MTDAQPPAAPPASGSPEPARLEPARLESGRLEPGRVLRMAFALLWANLPVLGGLTLASTLLLAGLETVITLTVLGYWPIEAGAPHSPVMSSAAAIRLAAEIAQLGFSQALVIGGIVRAAGGERPGLRDSLGAAALATLPAAVATIAYVALATVGGMLLIAPGLFLAALFAVAAPVRVVERRGLLAAFARSRALTAGRRWATLGVMLTATVLLTAIYLAWTALPLTLLGALWLAIGHLLWAAIIGALYVELRRLRDGLDDTDLGAVFD